ncbi:MAG TPA: hypothetical protein VK155_18950 [Bacteroidales bacterium]|jgi:hypothetical protein|nr:hypothetical protein [Bacteroidales bacterium]
MRDKKFNPFPGLRPFAPEESDLFFGRKGESAEVLGKLLKNRFVTVMGASGTGKSSLIYCGVLPGVRKLEDGPVWKIITFRPGNDPFANLAKALNESVGNGQASVSPDDPGGITGMIASSGLKEGEKALLVIDQFEELFRYGSLGNKDIASSERFVNSLVKSVSESTVNIFTIITMRSDFIGECASFQGLTQLINNSNYLVPHMGRDNYREAIEGPVAFAGAKIDPALVNLLLDDIGERTDQLPVLQHAMMRTWTYWQELDDQDRPISKAEYDSVGTMSNAMSMHANEAFEELSPRGKEICEKMFKTITDKGSDNKGLRRPTAARTIMSIAGCTASELFEVVERFRIPSRSFITPRQNINLNEDSIIDVSHESLMRLWDRLREWVEDEASSVQMYTRLSEASAMYQQGRTSLWRPPDLQLAINWRDQHKPTLEWAQRYDPAFERAMVYLRTSEREFAEEEENKIRLQKRQLRRANIVTAIVSAAAFVSIAFMLFAFMKKIEADRQTKLAVEAQKLEIIQRTRADSNANVAQQEGDRAIKEAARATNEAIRADSARREAIKAQLAAQANALEANRQRRNAVMQKDTADRARVEALRQQGIAVAQKDTALMLRMLSIGKAMSIKSLQANDRKDLQALLAYQAYIFNTRYNGPQNDADIYAGLYNVARQAGKSDCRSFKGHNGTIRSIAYVPGKREFYTSGEDGKVLKWSLDKAEQSVQVVYSGFNEKTKTIEVIDVLALSPDAQWLACGSRNSSIRMIPLKQNTGGYILSGHKGKIKSLVFSYDGKYIYSAALDGRVLKWDLAARTSVDMTDGSVKITSIDVSSNGKYIAGVSTDGSVMVWDPDKKSNSFSLPTQGREIMTVRFNPDNNLLAVGDKSGTVELWDVSKNRKISVVKAHDGQVNDIRFNPVLKQMATAGNDSRMKIFDLTDPYDLTQPPITFSNYEGYVMTMQFSSDGQLIVSGAYEGTENLICSPTNTDYFASEMCNLLTRNMSPDEWKTYVAPDIPPEQTCSAKNYNISISAIK